MTREVSSTRWLIPLGALLAIATLVGLVLGDGGIGLALTAPLCAAIIALVCFLPLRYSVMTLAFFALTLENPADAPASGLWKSPLYTVGALFLTHLNVTFPSQHWLLFSGLDVALVLLLIIAACRRSSRSRLERDAGVTAADPMGWFALLSLGAAAWMWIWGVVTGGADVASSLWQVQRVVYLPVVLFLFQMSLRGARDATSMGKVLLAAACVKAALAIYVRMTVPPPPGEEVLPYATTHFDSMLFATALAMVVLVVLERFRAKLTLFAFPIIGLLVGGMVANNRRVVWVEVLAALALAIALSHPTPRKRKLLRAGILTLPITLVYLGLGWSSESGIFRPVHVLRTVIDSKADASTGWRDLENYDLFYTLKQHPLLGTGFGHGYEEYIKLPDVSGSYSLYRFLPHNSILGLFTYGGLIGFTALFSVFAVGLFLAVRTHLHGKTPVERVASLTAACSVVVFFVHCYGDMGLGTWTAVFLVAPALALSSQLAVATGAWPKRSQRYTGATGGLAFGHPPPAHSRGYR